MEQSTREELFEYIAKTDLKTIQEENGLEEDEILLPDASYETLDPDFLNVEPVGEDEDVDIEFVMLPAGKYEMLIRDSERLATVTRYVCSDKPCIKAVKALLEVEA